MCLSKQFHQTFSVDLFLLLYCTQNTRNINPLIIYDITALVPVNEINNGTTDTQAAAAILYGKYFKCVFIIQIYGLFSNPPNFVPSKGFEPIVPLFRKEGFYPVKLQRHKTNKSDPVSFYFIFL